MNFKKPIFATALLLMFLGSSHSTASTYWHWEDGTAVVDVPEKGENQ